VLPFAGTALARHEAEVGHHLVRIVEARDVVERGDERGGGHWPDARRRGEPPHAWVLRGEGCDPAVRRGDLRVQRLKYGEKWCHLDAQGVGDGAGRVEHRELGRRPLRLALREACPVAPDQRLEVP